MTKNQGILFVIIGGSVSLGAILTYNTFTMSTNGYKTIVYEANPNPQVSSTKIETATAKIQPIATQTPKSTMINGVSVTIPGSSSRKVPKTWGTFFAPAGEIEKWIQAGSSGFKTGNLKRSDLDAITAFEISRYKAEGNVSNNGVLSWTTNALSHQDPCACSPIGQYNFGGDSAASVVDRYQADAAFKSVFVGALAAHTKVKTSDFKKLVDKGDFEGIRGLSIKAKLPVYLTLTNLNSEKANAPIVIAKLKNLGIYDQTPTSIVMSFFDQANQAGAGGASEIINIYHSLSSSRSYLISRLIKLGVSDAKGIVTTNNDEVIDLNTLPEDLLRLSLARTVYFNANGTESDSFTLHHTSTWLNDWAGNWTYASAKSKDPTLKPKVLEKIKAAKPGVDLDALKYGATSDGNSVTVIVTDDKSGQTIVKHTAPIKGVRSFTPQQAAWIDLMGRYGQGYQSQTDFDAVTKALPAFRDQTAKMFGIK